MKKVSAAKNNQDLRFKLKPGRSKAKRWAFDIESYPNYFRFEALSLLPGAMERIDDYFHIYDFLSDPENVEVVSFMVFADEETGESVNELKQLQHWIRTEKPLLVGYNSEHYDNVLVNRVLDKKTPLPLNSPLGITKRLFNLTKILIEKDPYNLPPNIQGKVNAWLWEEYDNPYHVLDLIGILTVNMNKPSLKHCMIHMRWPIILNLPIEPGSIIRGDQVAEMNFYHSNDTKATKALEIVIEGDISFREKLALKHENRKLFSASDVKIGKLILASRIEKPEKDATNYGMISGSKLLPKHFRYETETLKMLVKDLENTMIDREGRVLESFGVDPLNDKVAAKQSRNKRWTYNKEINILGLKASFGVGGFHSHDSDLPGTFTPTIERTKNGNFKLRRDHLLHVDATSYYPGLMLGEEIFPAHIGKKGFLVPFKDIVMERTEAKATMQRLKKIHKNYLDLPEYDEAKTEQEDLKIAINAAFGNLKSRWFWFEDALAFYRVTIGGQIYLIDLIEKLILGGIQVLSGNTDGLIVRVTIEQMNAFRAILKEWEERTSLSLEEDEIDIYTRIHVNSYVMKFSESSKPKKKGDFLTHYPDELGKRSFQYGFKAPIIAMALIEHFINNGNWEYFIKNHPSIHDFCYTERTGKQFKVVHRKTVINEEEAKNQYPNHWEDFKSRTKLGNRTKKSIAAETFFYEKGFIKDQDEPLQNTNRFYVGDKTGENRQIVKIYKEGHKLEGRELRVLADEATTILNHIPSTTKIDPWLDGYKVNYDYYIKQVGDLIETIEKSKGKNKQKPKVYQELLHLSDQASIADKKREELIEEIFDFDVESLSDLF